MAEGDGGDQVDEFAELGLVDLQATVLLVEHPLKLGVVLFDGLQGVVNQAANAADLVGAGLAVFDLDLGAWRQLGMVLQGLPAGQLRHPKDVLFGIVVADLQLGSNFFLVLFVGIVVTGIEVVIVVFVLKLRNQLLATDIEGIGNIFNKQQPQHGVLILGRIKSGAQLIGGGPELLFQGIQKFFFRHVYSTIHNKKALATRTRPGRL